MKLDRVTGAWRPLPEALYLRGTYPEMVEAIKPSLGGIFSGPAELGKLGIQLASLYGIQDVGPMLLRHLP